jgi:serine/threonine-protein kinase
VLEPKSLVAGRYEIVRVIGAGGMGSVYEAIHTVSKRSIALKILAPELCRNEATRERFLREASAPAQIGHPGIVEVFDAGFDPQTGALFVAMELLKGETLRERLERLAAAPTPEAREQALLLFGALLEPLAAAHSKNIVHRDIKPENIFLQRNALGIESVKVLDFGIARDVESDKPSVTRTGIAMGTPHYMAPEQAMSAREASFPADVWALGVILYEILSGTVPFPGETAGSIIAAAVTEAHRPLVALSPTTPAALSALVDRCLAKRPSERPAHAGALLEACREARRDAVQAIALPPAQPPVPAPLTKPIGLFGADATQEGLSPLSHTPAPASTPQPASLPTSPQAAAQTTQQPPGASSNASKVAVVGAVAALTFTLATCALFGVGLAIYFGMSSNDEAHAGTISRSDPVYADRFYNESTLQISAGESVDIYMKSGDFDPYLLVRGPDGFLQENDDADGSTNAHIELRNTRQGAYTVHATTYAEGAIGTYELRIDRQ